MSGESGASIEGENYSVFVGTGISISIDVGPDENVGDYFARESEPFNAWLERARPALDALFANSGLPLVPLRQKCEQVDGAIIEKPDQTADHFRRYYRGGPLLLHVDGVRQLDNFQSLRLRIAVSRRVHRAELDALIAKVAVILKAHAA